MDTYRRVCQWTPVVAGLLLFVGEAAGQAKGYVHVVRDTNGNVKEVVFSGSAEWLVNQDDPASHFHALPDLRRLTLISHDVSGEEMKYVASLSKVTKLDVGTVTWGLPEDDVRITAKSLVHIGMMPWLEELEISVGGLQDADWSFLLGCKSLKRLSTGPGVVLTDRFFEHAAQIPTLESLDLSGLNDSFSDEALKRVSELKKLRLLRISSPNVTDDGVRSLERLTELNTVIVHGSLTARSIEHLRPLHNLRDLRLGVREVPKSAMETIAEFKQLERLDLSNAELGDREIAPLRGHPSLKELYLNSARVTNRSSAVLESLENLRHVSLRGDDESQQIEEEVNDRIRRKRSTNLRK